MTPRPTARPAPHRHGTEGGQSSPLRRLPVPDPHPPFDDDQGFATPRRPLADTVQGTLALAFPLASGLPAVPSPPADDGVGAMPRPPARVPRLRLVTRPAGGGQAGEESQQPRSARRPCEPDDDFGPQPTPRTLLPPPRPWAARLVQAIVEVGAGARPVSQLVRWTTTEVYDALRHRTTVAPQRPRTIRVTVNAQLRSVHVSEPDDGVAEVCAIVAHGMRCRVVALRLEGVDGRWQCTALQFG